MNKDEQQIDPQSESGEGNPIYVYYVLLRDMIYVSEIPCVVLCVISCCGKYMICVNIPKIPCVISCVIRYCGKYVICVIIC